ncbi:MAG: hypothetical protein JWM93_1804 [Frankiales bacterium]|nr:hypothetical protein [Frankiales bacterium]
MHPDLTGAERQLLAHLHVVAGELRATAQRLRCLYLSAHLPIADGGLLVFTYDNDVVIVTGPGFEAPLLA